ncbi:ABC transporter permease [Denitratisoma sp. DHT3]|uniref:ABC transporter permease n=1 Tax=Denitratisoma sp. DHT3 TaxID=1981880 RepID=UPI00119860C2|nr:ABC transporter permease [Denitratisoma sp. DHT3]QDX82287.1 ABC transporter permease [Denitratisoma sp. DHT3]
MSRALVAASNIFRLGVKELRSFLADRVLLMIIAFAFSFGIFAGARSTALELRNAPVGVVDLDRSPLSLRIIDALRPPYFRPPVATDLAAMDAALDKARFSFVLVIPADFQRNLERGRRPELQLDIDATIMSQSFVGASYIQKILAKELARFTSGRETTDALPVNLVSRIRFNPNLSGIWFGGVMETINNITMMTIILVGAAFIREREHGTVEHLLVMPLTPFEIMMAKVWANGLVVLAGATFALTVVVQGILRVPIAGSLPLFLAGTALYLFSAASIGIFLGTLARSMPQFGLLIILVVLPLHMLSGGISPRESMPEAVQNLMLAAPTTWFVRLAQGILYRGASLDIVWPEFLAITGIGAIFFLAALVRFRRSVTQTQL